MLRRVIGTAVLFTLGCSGHIPALDPAQAEPSEQVPVTGTPAPYGHPTGTPKHEQYPLVLVHGFSGFQNIGPINYFYGVADALRNGGHSVFLTQVDPYNNSFKRGAELLTQVQQILASTGAAKVNLICHSQGGLDARYVASQIGDRIGAVVMISTPSHGTALPDVAERVLRGAAQDAVDALLNLLGAAVLAPGTPLNDDARASIHAMSSAGADAFSAAVPDHPGVAYYSVAGRSNNQTADADCGSTTEAPWMAQYDPQKDTVNAILSASATILNNSYKVVPTNDGLITVASSKWGTFLGCLPSDHFSEVCQIAGRGDFDCVPFYRQLANWLVERGF